MKSYLFLLLALATTSFSIAQSTSDKLRSGAVRVDDPENLSDAIFQKLSPYPIIMVGEMHGTNEPAAFVTGLAKLFAKMGDTVQVGFEIPPEQMELFIRQGTDSSVYQSKFFADPDFEDGRGSHAWAGLIAKLCGNPKVKLFFYDLNKGEEGERDSLMYLNIKRQYLRHPNWRMVTLSGNYHNRDVAHKMIWFLRQDIALGLSKSICSLNHLYLKGSCRANFGQGLELRELETNSSAYDTTFDFDNYLYLMSKESTYPYTGFIYTKYITAANMVKEGD